MLTKPTTQHPEGRWQAHSDDTLMLMARDGESQAFDILVRRYERQLMRSAHRYMGNETLARDVAQRTLVELYRYVPRYQPDGKFERLLWRILINQCRSAWRHRDTDARALRRLATIAPEPVAMPSAHVVHAQDTERLRQAMAQLSEKLRSAIVLRFVS